MWSARASACWTGARSTCPVSAPGPFAMTSVRNQAIDSPSNRVTSRSRTPTWWHTSGDSSTTRPASIARVSTCTGPRRASNGRWWKVNHTCCTRPSGRSRRFPLRSKCPTSLTCCPSPFVPSLARFRIPNISRSFKAAATAVRTRTWSTNSSRRWRRIAPRGLTRSHPPTGHAWESAHQSALQGGAIVRLPDFTLSAS